MKNTTFISAGAGSGKTYRLTKEIAQMITEGKCKAEQIILTTFTDAAAKELREKVRSTLYSKGLYEAAMNIDNAAIGTIHSIAYQFVSRYWYLLGISANVSIMDTEGSKFCISQSLASLPEEEDLALFENILISFNVTKSVVNIPKPNPDFWKDDLKNIIDKTVELNIDEGNLEKAKEKSKELLGEVLKWNDEDRNIDVASVLENAETSLHTTGNQETKQIIEDNIKAVKSCKDIHIHGIYNLAKKIHTDSKTKKKYPNIADFFEKLYKSLPRSIQVQNLVESYIETIFRLAIKWKKEYEEFKRKRCLLDFGDLLQKFYELLSKEEVVDDIKDRYKVALVDEFQDCSPLQVKSFERLSELMDRSIWVGDIKQAIYGFRGTNTELINSIIDKVNKKKDGNKLDTLKHCWRSNETIVNLVNNIFCEKVFKGQLHEDLIKLGMPTRTENDPPKPQERELRHVHLDAKKADNSYQLIADLIAEQLGTFNANEIAVLFRDKYGVEDCAKALKKRGIAYNVRFDNNSEDDNNNIDNISSFINAVVSFAAREDNQLSKAIIANRVESGYSTSKLITNRLQDIESENKSNSWLSDLDVIRHINDIRESIGNQSVSSAIETIIVELNLVDLIKRIDPAAPVYNYCSALESKVATYEGLCANLGLSSTLVGFAEYLNEHPIEYPGNDNGVSVMTYHKSKGLEWPCVILCSLHKAPVDPDKTFFGILTNNTAKDTPLRFVPSVIKDVCKSIMDNFEENEFFKGVKRATINEAKRLMYVGMTRPKEQLILTSQKPKGKNSKDDPDQWLYDIGCDKIDVTSNSSTIKWGEMDWNHSVCIYEAPEEDETAIKEACKFMALKQPTERSSFDVKFVSPSKVKDDKQQYSAEKCSDFATRISVTANDGKDSTIGDFIHHAMCLWNGDKSIIETLAKEYDIKVDNLDAVSTSINKFWNWMEETYGKATAIERELPFSFINENGQVISGEIDLVYRTAEGDVLVDYKTYQGSVSELTNPDSDFNTSKKYGNQIALYAEALKRRGSHVRDRLVCYISLGVTIRVK